MEALYQKAVSVSLLEQKIQNITECRRDIAEAVSRITEKHEENIMAAAGNRNTSAIICIFARGSRFSGGYIYDLMKPKSRELAFYRKNNIVPLHDRLHDFFKPFKVSMRKKNGFYFISVEWACIDGNIPNHSQMESQNKIS